MDISETARKHGVDDEDIVHAWENAIRYVEYEYQGKSGCSKPVGVDDPGRFVSRDGDELEHPAMAIGSDHQPKFLGYLR